MDKKLFAIIGKKGMIVTAELLDISYPTLKKRLLDFGEFKQSEIKKIDEIYNDLFGDNE
jgi:hypothetical protein